MACDHDRGAFLREHYRYELLMLRYTIRRLGEETHQLEWNALFESCATHLRNLRDFLTNDRDSRNYKATDFGVEGIASRQESHGLFDAINAQVDHLGKRRPFDIPGGKKTFDDLRQAAKWVEDKHAVFIERCDGELKSGWTEPSGEPEVGSAYFGSTPPTSSSYPMAITSMSPATVSVPGEVLVVSTTKGEEQSE